MISRKHATNPTCFAWVLVLAALVMGGAVTARAQNLVANGSFEIPAGVGSSSTYSGVDTTSLTGWVVDQAGTSIDHIGSLWNAADGAQSLDMNGLNAGTIYQDLTTTPGQAYRISFAMAGNPFGRGQKNLALSWDGAAIQGYAFSQHDFYTPFSMGWVYVEAIAFAAHTSTRLTFSSGTGPMYPVGPTTIGMQEWYGPALDDVRVTAIPEPGSAALTILTLAGLGFCRRRNWSPFSPPLADSSRARSKRPDSTGTKRDRRFREPPTPAAAHPPPASPAAGQSSSLPSRRRSRSAGR
jgi:hypothetical protein